MYFNLVNVEGVQRVQNSIYWATMLTYSDVYMYTLIYNVTTVY